MFTPCMWSREPGAVGDTLANHTVVARPSTSSARAARIVQTENGAL